MLLLLIKQRIWTVPAALPAFSNCRLAAKSFSEVQRNPSNQHLFCDTLKLTPCPWHLALHSPALRKDALRHNPLKQICSNKRSVRKNIREALRDKLLIPFQVKTEIADDPFSLSDRNSFVCFVCDLRSGEKKSSTGTCSLLLLQTLFSTFS